MSWMNMGTSKYPQKTSVRRTKDAYNAARVASSFGSFALTRITPPFYSKKKWWVVFSCENPIPVSPRFIISACCWRSAARELW